MYKKINEAQLWVKHIQCDCKSKFNSITCSSNQNGIPKHFNVRLKFSVHAKTISTGI